MVKGHVALLTLVLVLTTCKLGSAQEFGEPTHNTTCPVWKNLRCSVSPNTEHALDDDNFDPLLLGWRSLPYLAQVRATVLTFFLVQR